MTIKNITVGDEPRYIAVNSKTNMIYVTNSSSGTVSVINGTTKNVTADLRFSINPPNAASIICNNQKNTKNFTRYSIGSSVRCEARSNDGFQFSSWSGNFDLNRSPVISSVFDFIYYSLFGNKYANSIMNNPYDHDPNNVPSTTFAILFVYMFTNVNYALFLLLIQVFNIVIEISYFIDVHFSKYCVL